MLVWQVNRFGRRPLGLVFWLIRVEKELLMWTQMKIVGVGFWKGRKGSVPNVSPVLLFFLYMKSDVSILLAPLTLLTISPLTLTFPFALTAYLFVAHTLGAPNMALGAAVIAGTVTALVGLFCVGLVKDTWVKSCYIHLVLRIPFLLCLSILLRTLHLTIFLFLGFWQGRYIVSLLLHWQGSRWEEERRGLYCCAFLFVYTMDSWNLIP